MQSLLNQLFFGAEHALKVSGSRGLRTLYQKFKVSARRQQSSAPSSQTIMAVDLYAIYDPESTEPSLVGIGHALMLAISIYWASFYVLTTVHRDRVRTLCRLGLTWMFNAFDSLLNAIAMFYWMQCGTPYIHIQPQPSRSCPGMFAYQASNFTFNLMTGMFSYFSVRRLLLSTQAIGETSTARLLRVARFAIVAGSILVVVATAMLVPIAAERPVNFISRVSFPERFYVYTISPYYLLVCTLNVTTVVISYSLIFRISSNAHFFSTAAWKKGYTPEVLALKARERKQLQFAGLMIMGCTAIMVAVPLATLSAADKLSIPLQSIIYGGLARLYGSCQMLALNSLANALVLKRSANDLMISPTNPSMKTGDAVLTAANTLATALNSRKSLDVGAQVVMISPTNTSLGANESALAADTLTTILPSQKSLEISASDGKFRVSAVCLDECTDCHRT